MQFVASHWLAGQKIDDFYTMCCTELHSCVVNTFFRILVYEATFFCVQFSVQLYVFSWLAQKRHEHHFALANYRMANGNMTRI